MRADSTLIKTLYEDGNSLVTDLAIPTDRKLLSYNFSVSTSFEDAKGLIGFVSVLKNGKDLICTELPVYANIHTHFTDFQRFNEYLTFNDFLTIVWRDTAYYNAVNDYQASNAVTLDDSVRDYELRFTQVYE